MNRKLVAMTMAVAAAALTAAAAPTEQEKAAQKKADELRRTVQQNNGRVNQLRQELERTSQDGNRKAKNFAAVVSNVDEIVRLVTLKEGAASNSSVADAKLLLARAYARPVNLRYVDEAKKAYAAAVEAAAPDRKASVERELALYLYAVGEGPLPADPPDNAAQKPPLTDAPALVRWYQEKVKDQPWWSGTRDPLKPENAPEALIATCDQALSDLAGQDLRFRMPFIERKVSLLRGVCRWDDAEKILLGELAKVTNVTDRARITWLTRLADLYEARAARYYEKPDRALTDKAIWYLEEALRLDPKNTGYMRKIVERGFMLDDYVLAKTWLDHELELRKDHKPDEWMAGCYGDIAFFAGDYELAVTYYEMYPNIRSSPSRVRIPNAQQRYAGALYALGRYEDCLKAIDKCPNFWSFKDTNNYYRKLLKQKIEEQKAKRK